ncbi:MAG: ROK family protein [Pleurocapsa minor GSE-CHR-MK-17-07R]|jgi:glucokinase|nr:ROK family protein [Pleurocapsa minor GSE-CHR-MK 17-07R]
MTISDTPAVIGVDIGGTKIAVVSSRKDGVVLADATRPTQAASHPDTIPQRIAEAIRDVISRTPADIAGIGIACPGPVDAIAGVALNAVNLGWKQMPIRQTLNEALGSSAPPIFLQNDVNALAVGEHVFGAGSDGADFVLMAMGTGLGGGAFTNGLLVNGARGCAMEVGHIVLHPNGRPCNCGLLGCAERYASGIGLADGAIAHGLVNDDGTAVSTRTLVDMARRGSAQALAVIDDAADALGQVMAWTAVAYDPARIIIGGGLGTAIFDLIAPRATRAMQGRLMHDIGQSMQVVPAQVSATALGAAALAFYGLEQRS